MPRSNEQVTAAGLRIDGVSESDPAGRIPWEQLINGTTIRIPRWDRFPDRPGRFTILHIYWTQNSVEEEIYTQTYTQVDDKPEFTFPLTPQRMSVDGAAFIHYVLEGFDGNKDPSPIKTLTIDHTFVPSLKSPGFPDASIWGYINCTPRYPESPPVWEKIRLQISAELIFREFDEFVLEWQGFSTLNGSPPALTPLHELRRTLSESDAENGFVFDIPFDPYVRPMFDNDSGIARYTIVRSGVPVAKSYDGLVKIDRIISGESIPCGGAP
jgi:hypothetical protein